MSNITLFPCFHLKNKAQYAQMSAIKYIFSFILGCLAAIIVGKIVSMSGAQTTVDAWFVTLTVVGQDVGDRMALFAKVLAHGASFQALEGMSYLVGHSILEEFIKFLAFFIAFHINKPTSIRQIVLTGITVGIGFALVETCGFYSFTALNLLTGFVLRAIWHGLFTGLIALLFGRGYFMQMLWIDSGAKGKITGWIVRYEEYFLQWIITLLGLVLAAIIHSSVDIFAALGGQSLAILFMMAGWMMFIFFLLRPESDKPYGTIIREVELLRHIVDEEKQLVAIEKSGDSHTLPIKATEGKILKILKRFAKQ